MISPYAKQCLHSETGLLIMRFVDGTMFPKIGDLDIAP